MWLDLLEPLQARMPTCGRTCGYLYNRSINSFPYEIYCVDRRNIRQAGGQVVDKHCLRDIETASTTSAAPICLSMANQSDNYVHWKIRPTPKLHKHSHHICILCRSSSRHNHRKIRMECALFNIQHQVWQVFQVWEFSMSNRSTRTTTELATKWHIDEADVGMTNFKRSASQRAVEYMEGFW